MRWLQATAVVVLALALALPALAAPKKPRPKPPAPPPDTADDCTLLARADIPDYLVLSTLGFGVECATAKGTISVTISEFTRDGASVPLVPYDTLTCSATTRCAIAIDLFSYDNHPVAFPGDQRYCATGFGLVGGRVIGPASVCEDDPRL
jgi:hypothetical protein